MEKLYVQLKNELCLNYNGQYKIDSLKKKYKREYELMKGIKKLTNYKFRKLYTNIDQKALYYNEIIIQNKLEEYKEFFDNVSGISLDVNQRKAIIKDPNNLLIIAGAGSGKTLTIVGKVMYLLDNGVLPHEILCISFTNFAANSLKEKLKEKEIEVYTFHKLGLKILNEYGYKFELKNDLLRELCSKINYHDIEKIDDINFVTMDQAGNKTKSEEIIINNIFENSEEKKEYEKLIMTFINLYKGQNYPKSQFSRFYRKATKKEKKVLNLIERIYKEYQTKLKEEEAIDFNDMINKASHLILKKGIFKYKYIIIDEFQDTSLTKCNLIKNIQFKTKCKVVAVGDDWQSIYRFTGSSLNVFINFEKYFNYAEKVIINNVYRNSKEILKVSSDFIMKNDRQLKKHLNSNKNLSKPIKIYYYDKDYKIVLLKALNDLGGKALVLARNNKDVIKCKNINPKIEAITIHKSKGLEAENVIVVNLEDGILGFPNKVGSNKINRFVLNENDYYPYEEERRLFYVALTRTKNNVCLLVNKNKPSIFIKEIINSKNVQIVCDINNHSKYK